ncbi:Ground-like domain-containing protein [Aphelenchoides fujianensis]|nr:Ground-like domain-containing protein [Aphelenchoides fujianensis]
MLLCPNSLRFLLKPLFLLIFTNHSSLATFFGGGGGGGCGCQSQRPVCPPPPVCGPSIRQPQFQGPITIQGQCPPCDCSGLGGGLPISGGSPQLIPAGFVQQQSVVGGGSYAISPAVGGGGGFVPGPSLPNAYVNPGGTQFVGGPQLIVPQQTGGYAKQDRLSGYSTPLPGRGRHSSRGQDEDVYDEVLPTAGQQVADVSVDSKKLIPSYNDVYLKRNRFLRQLRNRALRQFSAKSLTDSNAMPQWEEADYQPSVCNNEKLGRVMRAAMIDDISMSKKLVRKAAELAFDGRKLDVLCASGEFSYSVYAKHYCEATRENITCFAFMS